VRAADLRRRAVAAAGSDATTARTRGARRRPETRARRLGPRARIAAGRDAGPR
jgi:hypothetical protein